MSRYDPDDERDYYARERYMEDHPEEFDGPGECCDCCLHRRPEGGECDKGKSLKFVAKDVYGADADGRRGIPEYLYECSRCGNEVSVH